MLSVSSLYLSSPRIYGVAMISKLIKKIEVSYAEYRLFYRALLQKRPMFLGSLLIVATPYRHCIQAPAFSVSSLYSSCPRIYHHCTRALNHMRGLKYNDVFCIVIVFKPPQLSSLYSSPRSYRHYTRASNQMRGLKYKDVFCVVI